ITRYAGPCTVRDFTQDTTEGASRTGCPLFVPRHARERGLSPLGARSIVLRGGRGDSLRRGVTVCGRQRGTLLSWKRTGVRWGNRPEIVPGCLDGDISARDTRDDS